MVVSKRGGEDSSGAGQVNLHGVRVERDVCIWTGGGADSKSRGVGSTRYTRRSSWQG